MGEPKAALRFGSETLLERLARILREVVEPLVVVARPDQPLAVLPAEITVARDRHDGRGPLEAIATGILALPVETGAAFIASCDLPWLRPEWIRFLIAQLEPADEAVIPRVDGVAQPLAGIYRTTLVSAIDARLARDERSVHTFLGTIRTRWIEAAALRTVDPELESLINVNTPAEYAAALQRGSRP
jgi:molybdopterin-guanine dinucleotide biosynthesis protein A